MSESNNLAIYNKLESLLQEIKPEDYVTPTIKDVQPGFKLLGNATEQMKCLWTVWSILKIQEETGKTHILKLAVKAAIGYEIGCHFDNWDSLIAINSSWQVYAAQRH